MADVQFPTNNFDAAHGGKQPDNTPNTDAIASNNYGRERTAPTLYPDEKYVDGDGLLYGLGMVAQRVLAKPKPSNKGGTVYDGLTNKGLIWSDVGLTSATLGLHYDGDMFDATDILVLKSTWIAGLFADSTGGIDVSYIGSGYGPGSIGIGLNLGKGVYIGTYSQSTSTYNKLNINLFNHNAGTSDVHDDINMSGLEFAGGDATADGAPANNQLRVKLYDLGPTGGSLANASGLEIAAPGEAVPGFNTSGGLRVKFGTGLTINSSGQLVVNSSEIVPDIDKEYPIDITTSGNTKTIKLLYDSMFSVDGTSHKLQIKKATSQQLGIAKVAETRTLGAAATLVVNNIDGNFIGVEREESSDELFVAVPTAGFDSNNKAVNGLVKIYAKKDTQSATPATTGDNYFGVQMNTKTTNDETGRIFVAIPTAGTSTRGIFAIADSVVDGDTTHVPTGDAVHDAIASAVAELEAADWRWQIMASLPTVTDANYDDYKTVIALILHSSSTTTGEDIYDEYVCIRTGSAGSYTYKWEKIGSTGFVTDNFVQKSDVLTATEVAAIVSDVFGF